MRKLKFHEVNNLYERFNQAMPGKFNSLPDFAQWAQSRTQAADFSSAFTDNWLVRGSNLVDRAFEPLGNAVAPVTGELASLFGEKYRDLGESIGEGVPRTFAETAAFFIPGGQAALPARIASWGARGLGGLSAFSKGYSDSGGNPWIGAVSAASTATVPTVGRLATSGAGRLMNRPLARFAADYAAKPLAQQAAGTGLNTLQAAGRPVLERFAEEGARQAAFVAHGAATQALSGENPLSMENLVANVVGNVAFAPFSVHDLIRGPKLYGPKGEFQAKSYTEIERLRTIDQMEQAKARARETMSTKFGLPGPTGRTRGRQATPGEGVIPMGGPVEVQRIPRGEVGQPAEFSYDPSALDQRGPKLEGPQILALPDFNLTEVPPTHRLELFGNPEQPAAAVVAPKVEPSIVDEAFRAYEIGAQTEIGVSARIDPSFVHEVPVRNVPEFTDLVSHVNAALERNGRAPVTLEWLQEKHHMATERALKNPGEEAFQAVENAVKARFDREMRQNRNVVEGMQREDARVQVEDAFREYFGEVRGYDRAATDAFTDVAVRISESFPTEPIRTMQASTFGDVLAEMDALGLSAPFGVKLINGERVTNPIVAYALGKKAFEQGELDTFMRLATIGHEVFHVFEGEAGRADVKSPVRKAFERFRTASENYAPEDRAGLLRTIFDLMVPEKFRQLDAAKIDGWIKAASQTPEEFRAAYAQMAVLGPASGSRYEHNGRLLREWLEFAPEELTDFQKGLYRHVGDMLEALQQSESQRQVAAGAREKAGPASQRYKALHDSYTALAKFNERQAANRTAFATILARTPEHIMRNAEALAANTMFDALGPVDLKGSDLKFSTTGKNWIDGVKAELRGMANNAVNRNRPNLYQRLFVPMAQLQQHLQKRGFDNIANAMGTLMGSQQMFSQLQFYMLSSSDPNLSILHNVKNGKPVRIEEHAAFQEVNKSVQSQQALNKIARELQTAQAAAKKAGKDFVDFPAIVRRHTGELSQPQRDAVTHVLSTMFEVYQKSGDVVFYHQYSNAVHGAVKIAQVLNPALNVKQALSVASSLLYQGIVSKDRIGRLRQASSLAEIRPYSLEEAVGVLGETGYAAVKDFFYGASEGKRSVVQSLDGLSDSFSKDPYFLSEQRPGRFLVTAKLKGNAEKDSWVATWGADNEAHAKKIIGELVNRKGTVDDNPEAPSYGDLEFDYFDKFSKFGNFAGLTSDAFKRLAELEDEAFTSAVARAKANFTGNEEAVKGISQLEKTYVPSRAVYQQQLERGLAKFQAQRHFAGGRADLDYVRAMIDYVQGVASVTSRTGIRNMMDAHLRTAEAKANPEWVQWVNRQAEATLNHNSKDYEFARTLISAFYLGGNISSMLVEATQSLQTLWPVIIERQGFSGAFKLMMDSFSDVVSIYRKSPKDNQFLKSMRGELYNRALRESLLDWGHLQEINLANTRDNVLTQRLGAKYFDETSTKDLLKNKAFHAMQTFNWFYSNVARFNQKVGFAAGLRLAEKAGLSGDAAYHYATDVLHQSMFGGGRPARPGYVAAFGQSMPVASLVHTLQQYGYSMTALLGRLGVDSIDGHLGRGARLTAADRRQAKAAFGAALATNLSFAGLMGLPFVGAAMTIVDELFPDAELHKGFREAVASLAGDDIELGGQLADIASNGFLNQVTGVDYASRVGLNSILGTSEYKGFDLLDFLGPAYSMGEGLVKATQSLGRGEPVLQGIQQTLPLSLRKPAELLQHQGKILDASNRLVYELNAGEQLKYALGFTPAELSRKRRQSRMLTKTDEVAAMMRDVALDRIARQLVGGDVQSAQAALADLLSDRPDWDRDEVTQMVATRARDMVLPVDPLRRASTADPQARSEIAATFGEPQRVSELERLKTQAQFEQLLGLTPRPGQGALNPKSLSQAMMIDRLTEMNPLLTGTAARRMVEGMTP